MSSSSSEVDRRRAEMYAKAFASFPFERIEVRGEDALSTWRKLKAERRGTPVVLGDDDSVVNLTTAFDPLLPQKSVAEIVDASSRVRIPDDLFARREAASAFSKAHLEKLLSGPDSELPTIISRDDGQGFIVSFGFISGPAAPAAPPRPPVGNGQRLLSPDETRAFLAEQTPGPEIGEWPSEQPLSTGLTIATDILTEKPAPKVDIALIPPDDWTHIPAYLRWGNWNDCPPPEMHVAALRSWRDRYGIELVGLSSDTMNLRATTRPATRPEALALAREQYAYCTDIIDQGVQTYSTLAASLSSDDWWYFWWD